MLIAIFLILAAAFVGRLVLTMAALRNWWLAIGVSAAALGVYSLTYLSGSPIGGWIFALHARIGFAASVVLAAVSCAIGFGVPVFLARTDRRGRRAKMLGVFIGVLASAYVVEVNRSALPDLWFAAGVAAFLVVKSRFYESEGDPGPADDWWDREVRRDRRRKG